MRKKLKQIDEKLPDKRFLLLLGIIGAATFLRLKYAFFEGIWVDEGRYGKSAVELMQHPWSFSGPEYWRGQITGFQPVFSYLAMIGHFLGGETGLRLISPVMGVVGVGVSYILGKEFFNKDVGLLTAALVTVNPTLWFLSERILQGMTLTVMYTSSIICLYYGLQDREYSKKALWASGPLAALTWLTKQSAASLAIVIVIFTLYERRNVLRKLINEFDRDLATSEFKDLGIGGGLGLLLLTPWMLRNISVCGFPFCGLLQAVDFTDTGVGNPAVTHVQDLLFFITNLPGLITVPVFFFIGIRLAYYVLEGIEDPVELGKKLGVYVVSIALISVLYEKFIPLVAVTLISIFVKDSNEKLIWIWAGIGIGLMSIPAVKDPRYIAYTLPGLMAIAGVSIYDTASYISKLADTKYVTSIAISLVLLVPLVSSSYQLGLQNVQKGGFSELEPAGYWMDDNLPEDANIGATSAVQTRYYTHPRKVLDPTNDEEKFKGFLRNESIDYLEVDIYEPTQPDYLQTKFAPYRVPNSDRVALQRGEISQRQLLSNFSRTPDYVTPIKSFGKARNPIGKRTQPVVIIYKVNRSALE